MAAAKKSSKKSTDKPTRTRAEINRENAQKSTGPKTEAGKQASSQNAFKHSLYSKQLVVPGEDPAQLTQLRAELRAEHQPATTTEEILVDELAQHYWRMRRIRDQETQTWQKGFEGPPDYRKLEFFTRALNSTERSFHKTLNALQQLQKARGFVPQKTTLAQPAAAVAAPAPVSDEAIRQVLECLFPPDAQNPEQTGSVSQILNNPDLKAARQRLAAESHRG